MEIKALVKLTLPWQSEGRSVSKGSMLQKQNKKTTGGSPLKSATKHIFLRFETLR